MPKNETAKRAGEHKRTHPRQQAFTRSHHRASMRMRAGTLSGAMSGDPRDQRR